MRARHWEIAPAAVGQQFRHLVRASPGRDKDIRAYLEDETHALACLRKGRNTQAAKAAGHYLDSTVESQAGFQLPLAKRQRSRGNRDPMMPYPGTPQGPDDLDSGTIRSD